MYYKFRWTEEELRIFELLEMRRYVEVIEACKEILEERDGTNGVKLYGTD